MKLTGMQRKALLEMADQRRVGESFMPNTVKSLVEAGLAERVYSVVSFRKLFAITDAGRAALQDGDST